MTAKACTHERTSEIIYLVTCLDTANFSSRYHFTPSTSSPVLHFSALTPFGKVCTTMLPTVYSHETHDVQGWEAVHSV